MDVLLIILIIIIACIILYMCKYNSVENFTEASLYETNGLTSIDETTQDLHFDKSFEINANTIDFHKQLTFKKDMKLEDNTKVHFNQNAILNSEHSIHFQGRDSRVKLSRDHLLNIKKNRSKIDYIKSELENAVLLEEGDVTGIYSAKTTGNDACTSMLWDIAIGKEVSRQELCAVCCKNVRNTADFKAFLSFENNTVATEHQTIHIDLTNGKLFKLVELNTSPTLSYKVTSTLFKNNTAFDCKLHFILVVGSSERNVIRGINKIEALKNALPPSSIKQTLSTTDEDNVVTVEWGSIDKGIYIPTTTHVDGINANILLLEIIPKESDVNKDATPI